MKTVFLNILCCLVFLSVEGQVGGRYVAQNGFVVDAVEVQNGMLLTGGGETVFYQWIGGNKFVNAQRASSVIINGTSMVLYINGGSSLLYKSNNQYNNSSNGYVKEEKECSVCRGTGYSNAVIWAPDYSGTSTRTEWCNICKSSRKPHTHKPCYSCGGTGYK